MQLQRLGNVWWGQRDKTKVMKQWDSESVETIGRELDSIGGLKPPERKGHGALLGIKTMLAEDAHRHVLYHWATVCACFRAPAGEMEDVPFPLASGDEAIAPPAGRRGFDSRAQPGTLRARKVGDLLRYVKLTDINRPGVAV